MTTFYLNFTAFDLQLWPPRPLYTRQSSESRVFYTSTVLQILLIYVTVSCNFLGIEGIDINRYLPPGLPRTFWHAVVVGHYGTIAVFACYLCIQQLLDLAQAGSWDFLVLITIQSVLEALLKPSHA